MFSINTKKKFIVFVLLLALGTVILPPIAQAADPISILDNRIEEIDGKTVNISWKTDTATKGKIIFGKSAQEMNYYIVDNSDYKTYHEVELGNLEPETTYYYQIIVYNSSEQATSYVKSFETDEYNDGLAPQLSNVDVEYVSGTKAFITWDSHEAATSIVEYSIDESYSLKAYSRSRVEEHQIILKNLQVNTLYYMRVYSIDQDGNQSSYHYRTFRTNSNDTEDNADLEITHFRPSSYSDSLVTSDSVIVKFDTNRYAKGKVTISRSGFRSQSQELEYGSTHQANFSELSPDTEYKITVSMTDIFGKKLTEYYNITTKEIVVAGISASFNDATTAEATYNQNSGSYKLMSTVSSEYYSTDYVDTSRSGYYGCYYNLSTSYSGFDIVKNYPYIIGVSSAWFSEGVYAFSRYDNNLNFGDDFFPVNQGKYGDPYYFHVYWRAVLDVPETGYYQYDITVDNGGWIFVDGQLSTNLDGYNPPSQDTKNLYLSKGVHYLEIFFSERGPNGSIFSFNINGNLNIHPWLVDCTGAGKDYNFNTFTPNYNYIVKDSGNSNNTNNNGNENIVVAGAEFSMYTEATALYKTYDSPDVWAIMNGQRHYISSPASFNEYGFNWYDIKTVTQAELEKYPRARLIRSGEGDIIYYLYQRPEGQWLKINITSPTVFISYPGNYWGNVIDVTQLDIDSYPDVRLIKTADSNEIYYLSNNERHLVSEEVFVAKGFNQYEVAEVNDTHMKSYKIATPLQ